MSCAGLEQKFGKLVYVHSEKILSSVKEYEKEFILRFCSGCKVDFRPVARIQSDKMCCLIARIAWKLHVNLQSHSVYFAAQ